MKSYQITKILLCSAFAVACAGNALANPITTLFNTGVNGSGVVLADRYSPDPHYTLTVVPSGGTNVTRVKTSSSGHPVGPWLGDNLVSAWIGPNSGDDLYGLEGNYTYQTTFDLTGFNPSTASIRGKWSSDNEGVGIWLNGTTQIGFGTSDSQFKLGYVDFTATSGFISGLNTLEFKIYNRGGPTGLRVEMAGSVPDGGLTVALLGMSLSGLAFFRRKLA